MMLEERRREIYERVVARMRSHGLEFEQDPYWLARVQEWIAGSITIQQLQASYGELLQSRRERRTPSFAKSEDS
jgi:hypothetical protein